MSEETKSLFNMFAQRHTLPHIPAAVLELQKLLVSPEVDIRELNAAVRKDPVIASEVVRAFEGMKRIQSGASRLTVDKKTENADLSHAISFIGNQQLSSIVMVAALRKHSLQCSIFSAADHWDLAGKTALIAEHLWVSLYSKEGKDTAYLAGYLCNIGKLVLAMGYPNETDKIVQYISDPKTQTTWLSAEKIMGVPDHRLLGEIGSAFWGFSDSVKECIRGHHTLPPYDKSYAYASLVSVVGLANILTHWINAEPHRFNEADISAYEEHLGLDRVELEKLIEHFTKLNG